ncbi:unnamed protein product [Chrysoparadoxa australica]
MCEREATLIKADIILEREQVERDRAKMEREDVDFRIKLAKTIVMEYSESPEGRAYYQRKAIAKAESITREKEAGKYQSEAEALLARRKDQINAGFEKDKAKLLKVRDDRLADMRLKVKEMEAAAETLRGWGLEQKEAQIDELVKSMKKLPEDKALAALHDKWEQALEKAVTDAQVKTQKTNKKVMFKKMKRGGKVFQDLVDELLIDMVNRDAEKEGKRAEARAHEDHAVIRRIMAMWIGLGMRETFADWKAWTQQCIRRRRRDRRQAIRQAWHDFEAANVVTEMAEWKMNKWEEHWDEYNDIPYWIHCETRITRYEPVPTIEEFMPEGHEIPKPPAVQLEDLSDSDDTEGSEGDSSLSSGSESEGSSGNDNEISSSSSSSSSSGSGSEESSEESSEDVSDSEDNGSNDGDGSDGHGDSNSESGDGDDKSEAEKDAGDSAGGDEPAYKAQDAQEGTKTDDGDDGRGNTATSSTDAESCSSAVKDQLAAAAQHARDRKEKAEKRSSRGGSSASASAGSISSNSHHSLVARLETEASNALARARQHRQKSQARFKKERDTRKELQLLEEEGSERIEVTVDSIMQMVGYDSSADYSMTEMTKMSEAALKLMKEHHVDPSELQKFGMTKDFSGLA